MKLSDFFMGCGVIALLILSPSAPASGHNYHEHLVYFPTADDFVESIEKASFLQAFSQKKLSEMTDPPALAKAIYQEFRISIDLAEPNFIDFCKFVGKGSFKEGLKTILGLPNHEAKRDLTANQKLYLAVGSLRYWLFHSLSPEDIVKVFNRSFKRELEDFREGLNQNKKARRQARMVLDASVFWKDFSDEINPLSAPNSEEKLHDLKASAEK